MKKFNKKGFTIVELVIVIAVIAILAAVLIPTFSGVVSKANASSALQEATSTMKSSLSMSSNGTLSNGTLFVIGDKDGANYVYAYDNNAIVAGADRKTTPLYVNSSKQIAASNASDATAIYPVVYNTTGTTKYNSIIISSDATATDATVLKLINTVVKTENTTAISTLTSVTNQSYKWSFVTTEKVAKEAGTLSAQGNLYSDAACTTQVPAGNYSAGDYYVKNTWQVFTNEDFAKDIVVFTYSK